MSDGDHVSMIVSVNDDDDELDGIVLNESYRETCSRRGMIWFQR